MRCTIGFPEKDMSGFGTVMVCGRNREPRPAIGIINFIFSVFLKSAKIGYQDDSIQDDRIQDDRIQDSGFRIQDSSIRGSGGCGLEDFRMGIWGYFLGWQFFSSGWHLRRDGSVWAAAYGNWPVVWDG